MRRPVRDALGLGILLFLTLGIGALDCATGRNISLWFVYVLPICLAAAIGGLRAGLAFSLLAAVLLVAVGLSVGHHFPHAQSHGDNWAAQTTSRQQRTTS